MDREKQQAFRVRITESNRTGLVAIMYDMMDEYCKDAIAARKADDHDSFKENIRGVTRVLQELKATLNFDYPLTTELYRIYTFCQEELSRSMYRYDTEGISEARKLLNQLGDSFRKLASADNTPPVMRNTETVSYGVTYGKTDISESVTSDSNRGFLA